MDILLDKLDQRDRQIVIYVYIYRQMDIQLEKLDQIDRQ